jgi:hypothetical protein
MDQLGREDKKYATEFAVLLQTAHPANMLGAVALQAEKGGQTALGGWLLQRLSRARLHCTFLREREHRLLVTSSPYCKLTRCAKRGFLHTSGSQLSLVGDRGLVPVIREIWQNPKSLI